MLSLYRGARGAVSIWQDFCLLYGRSHEKKQETEREIELISDFREPALCYEADLLLASEAEPFDSGWALIGAPTKIPARKGDYLQDEIKRPT